ncbi:hypothetical protein ABZP36_021786 [Zizania latifolia]
MPTVTCNACNSGFDDEEQHHLHYRSEWHRNLKRKLADASPLPGARRSARCGAPLDPADLRPPPPPILCIALWIEPPLHTHREKRTNFEQTANSHEADKLSSTSPRASETDKVTERILSDATAAAAAAARASSARTHSIHDNNHHHHRNRFFNQASTICALN